MTTERRRQERLRSGERLLADAFAYANSLAGLPHDAEVERALSITDDRSTWTWTADRTYHVHQRTDGTTSVEVTLA